MDESIERLAHEIGGSFRSRAWRFARASKFAKWLLVLCSAGATGLHFFTSDLQTWAAHVGIGMSVIIFLSGILLLFLDEDASQELECARKCIEKAREYEIQSKEILSDVSDYESSQTRANELYLAMHNMREAIERSFETNSINTLELVSAILESARRRLIIASGFSIENHYTICIYQARKSTSS